jgi:hypothetical protein
LRLKNNLLINYSYKKGRSVIQDGLSCMTPVRCFIASEN